MRAEGTPLRPAGPHRMDYYTEENRRLDILVAERVLDFRWYRIGMGGRALFSPDQWQYLGRRPGLLEFVLADPRDGLSADWFLNLGEYSTEITHAAELVPAMYDKGFECAQILVTHEGCSAAFGRTDAYLEHPVFVERRRGDCEAMAICLAALAAMGGD